MITEAIDDEPVPLAHEQAVMMLGDEPEIHTFRQAGIMLVGANWPRQDVIAAIQKWGAELSGPKATAMKHGIAFRDDRSWVFVETKKSA